MSQTRKKDISKSSKVMKHFLSRWFYWKWREHFLDIYYILQYTPVTESCNNKIILFLPKYWSFWLIILYSKLLNFDSSIDICNQHPYCNIYLVFTQLVLTYLYSFWNSNNFYFCDSLITFSNRDSILSNRIYIRTK